MQVSSIFNRTAPWEIGEQVGGNMTIEEVANAAGLNWKAIEEPIFTESGVLMKGYKGIYREDNQFPLSVVGSGYKVIQNEEMLQFNYNLIEVGDVSWETAGTFGGGKVVWSMVELPNERYDAIPGDENRFYVVVSNGFDGANAFKAAVVTVRIICWNTFNSAFKNAHNKYSIRHTKNAEQRAEDARKSLNIAFDWTKEFKEMSAHLAAEKMSNDESIEFARMMYPIPEDGTERSIENARAKQTAFARVYDSNREQFPRYADSKWIAFQSVTEMQSWKVMRGENRQERRFKDTILDDDVTKAKALKLLVGA